MRVKRTRDVAGFSSASTIPTLLRKGTTPPSKLEHGEIADFDPGLGSVGHDPAGSALWTGLS